jgi:23S rRNA (uracil1939-C5)-methyltransferase
VEGGKALVDCARHNARLNGISNAEFHVADLGQALEPQLPWVGLPYTHALLDPPRAGALAMLPMLARWQPLRLLYISCHPGTLARDIGILVHEHGFKLQAAGVLDMFPHTTHMESLALLLPGGRKGNTT